MSLPCAETGLFKFHHVGVKCAALERQKHPPARSASQEDALVSESGRVALPQDGDVGRFASSDVKRNEHAAAGVGQAGLGAHNDRAFAECAFADRAFAFNASVWRFRGGEFVTSDSRR